MNNLLALIGNNNLRIDNQKTQGVLLIIDLEEYPIGDSVLAFSSFRALQAYHRCASFDAYSATKHYPLLKNNPFIEKFFFDIETVAFERYDLIVFFTTDERKYLDILALRCNAAGAGFKAAVFSLTKYLVGTPLTTVRLLPVYDDFINYLEGEYRQERTVAGQELFLTYEEKEWADTWLRKNGIQEDEKIIVLLDSSGQRNKVLEVPVYFEMVNYFRQFEKTRILVFDEKSIGKEEFYLAWLGDEASKDFLFVKGLGLRQAISLLSSDYVEVIFGPCTGLLHCASGIYNIFLHAQVPFENVPLMIAYIGPDPQSNKWFWWGDSLVDCLYVEENARGEKQISYLTSPEYACLPCQEYTASLLINYFNKHYRHRLLSLGVGIS